MNETGNAARSPRQKAEVAIALPDLMMRFSGELGALAQLSTRVQCALSNIDLKDHCPGESIRDLQAIDRITQTLEDLAALAETLSVMVPQKLDLEATSLFRALTLTELVQNLDPREGAVHRPAPEDGDILWF